MTLQELIDELSALQPASSREATVLINGIFQVLSVSYTDGEVTIVDDDRGSND